MKNSRQKCNQNRNKVNSSHINLFSGFFFICYFLTPHPFTMSFTIFPTPIPSLLTLNPIHDRAARLIHDQDDLQSLNWLPLSYFYKRRLLLFMFNVIKHNVPDDLASLFTLKSGSRPSRRGSQFVIPRIKYEIGKQSIQYRGPTIWTFLNRLININESISKDKFKQILRRFSKYINNFLFRAPMI